MHIVRKKQMAEMSGNSPVKLVVSAKDCGAENCQAGLAVLKPGERLPQTGYSQHDSEEVSYIISGRIQVATDSEVDIAEEGDMILQKRNTPHFNVNVSDKEAVIVWFITPQTVPEK